MALDPSQLDPSQGNPALFQTPAGLQLANTPNFINAAYSTPTQRAQLYAYANELMKPQEVKNGWQGLGELARALVGGYSAHLADQYEAGGFKGAQQDVAGTLGGLSSGMAAGGAPAPGNALSPPPSGDYPNTQAGHEAYIRDYAASRGVDPGFAAAVAHGEGLGALSAKNPNSASNVDIDSNGKPFSFGDFQLNVRNGLGNTARAAGIDPADPNQWKAADKFSIDYMADHGAQPWRGDAGVNAYGIGKNGSWDAPRIAPAVAAIGHALVAGPGAPSPGGAPPMNPNALAHALVNPNIPDATRHAIIESAMPQRYQDVNNNVSYGSQFQAPQAPVFAGGRVSEQGTGSVPTIVTGSPNAPTVTPALPGGVTPGQTAGGQPLNLFGPGSMVGDLQSQKAATDAANAATQAKSAAAQQRFQQTQALGPQLMEQAYPLRQVQAILEKNGGNIPTGEGAERLQGAASIVNMVATALGHPLTNEDSRLTSMELLHKYGAQVAASQAHALGLPGTNAGQEMAQSFSPGTGLSQPSDTHLVDNLIRLNALAQKKNQFEHDYYLKNGQAPGSYDNFTQDWQKAVSGSNAIPLSKFGRDVKLKDGSAGVWVPSTDPTGFSLFRKDDPAFDVSKMTPGS